MSRRTKPQLPSLASGAGAEGAGGAELTSPDAIAGNAARRRPGWGFWIIITAGAMWLGGNSSRLSTTAQGDVRESPIPRTFLSGGERSEAVLKEMAETLKRIDQRLERFERALRETEPAADRRQGAPRGAAGDMAGQQAPDGAAGDHR